LVLLAFSIIGGFSIGMFYFPAAVVILAAAVFRIRVHDQPERPAPDDDFWSQRSDQP
jgi:sugar phosphate permease